MVLHNYIPQVPPFKEMKSEKNLVLLLKNVRSDINGLGSIKINRLDQALNYIERGSCDSERKMEGNVHLIVDLSKAQKLVRDYKFKSEGGCRSCTNHKLVKDPDFGGQEIRAYCKIGESAASIKDRIDYSPKIRKYFEIGCEDRKPIFRSIAEVLSEVE
ncbi:hypothetical protein GOV13_05015 [Candidatus Pacearchaeota archaeon]|nr:hypothetical protein [Candidatus Pacearchaeota archaeon]